VSKIGAIKKVAYLFFGFLFLGLGIVGILLPLLPTTPFLLLASFFFVRGSKKFDVWFKGTTIYKNHLEEFVRNRAMTLKQKATITLFASSVIAVSFVLVDYIWIRVLLVLIVIYKYYYFIFKIKTLSEKKKEDG
jgi:uncharacterized protein